MAAAHQVAEAHPDEPHALAPVVQPGEELVHHGQQQVVAGGVADALLAGVRVEVGVAHLDGDAAGELPPAAQLEGERFGHGGEEAPQLGHVDGVALEGALGADALAFMPGDHRAVVDAVGLAPQHRAVLAQQPLHQVDGHLLQGMDPHHAHAAQQVRGLAAHAGDAFDGHGGQEGLLGAEGHLQFTQALLGLAGGHLAHRLVDAEPDAVGQAGLLGDPLPQFGGQLPAAEEAVGAAEVHVELVHAALLEQGHVRAHDLGHLVALAQVQAAVAPQDDGLRAQLLGHLHGHGAADAEGAGLIAARSHHAAVAVGADQHGPAVQLRLAQPFHGNEEGVEVQMKDGARRLHDGINGDRMTIK